MGGWDEREAGKGRRPFHKVLLFNVERNFHKKKDGFLAGYVISKLRSISHLVKTFIKYFIKHC